jgi:hypothetical protein
MKVPSPVFRKPPVVPKRALAAVACATLVLLGTPAFADEYRAGELFSLDLSQAVLSPKRIGPPTEFAPVAVEARTDAKQAVVEPKADHQRIVRTTRVVSHTPVAKPRGAARTKLARRSNPLNAQAMDKSVQAWPCKSGGICNWKR